MVFTYSFFYDVRITLNYGNCWNAHLTIQFFQTCISTTLAKDHFNLSLLSFEMITRFHTLKLFWRDIQFWLLMFFLVLTVIFSFGKTNIKKWFSVNGSRSLANWCWSAAIYNTLTFNWNKCVKFLQSVSDHLAQLLDIFW